MEKKPTTIILVRHEKADPNGHLTPESTARAIRSAKHLKELHLIPDVMHSSPQPRALETAIAHEYGFEKTMPIITHSRLGDLTLGKHPFTVEEVASIKAKAVAKGMTPEMVLMSDHDYAKKIRARGDEGGQFLLDTIAGNPGIIIGVYSHGGSRIEAMIAFLRFGYSDDFQIDLEHTLEPGDIAVVLMEDDNETAKEILYFGNPGKEQARAAAAPIPSDEVGDLFTLHNSRSKE